MLRSWWAHAYLWGMNSDSTRSEWHVKISFLPNGSMGTYKTPITVWHTVCMSLHIFELPVYVLWEMDRRTTLNGSMGQRRKALQAISNRGQHTAHCALCTVCGEPQDDFFSKLLGNTVPAFVFFEGIRGTEAMAVKEGRGGFTGHHTGVVSLLHSSLFTHSSGQTYKYAHK